MKVATQPVFVKDSWQSPRNARTLQAYMALRNQEIGARLRELRGQKPQTTVAEELGVSERTYQNWEAGDAKPSYRNLQKLATYFGVGEDYILAGEPEVNGRADVTPSPFNGSTQLDRIEAKLDKILGLLTDDELAPLVRAVLHPPATPAARPATPRRTARAKK